LELFDKEAPLSTENFLKYVDDEHFDGTIFHRIVPGFVIQGGGLTTDFQPKKTRAPIANEATNGLKNERGTLSMARTNDVNSATSQFFVNLSDNAFLDHSKRNTATPSSAASPKAWMSLIRSPPCVPAPASSIRTRRLRM